MSLQGFSKRCCKGVFAVASVALLNATAYAHHSQSEYDRSSPMTINGTIREVDWNNPHVFIHVTSHNAATNSDETWKIEGASPGVMGRDGWYANSIKVGDKAMVTLSPLKGASVKEGLMTKLTINDDKVWISTHRRGGPGFGDR
jgi:hypothetical protein